MKPLETPSEGAVTAAECAESIVDVVPLVMRAIQAEMRSARTRGLSVPQFRALAYIDYHPGASLSDVAEHVGLTLPSTSKMIDGLVARELVARDVCAVDRRRIALALTERGRSVLDSARRGAEVRLAEELRVLPPADMGTVIRAMAALRQVFTSPT